MRANASKSRTSASPSTHVVTRPGRGRASEARTSAGDNCPTWVGLGSLREVEKQLEPEGFGERHAIVGAARAVALDPGLAVVRGDRDLSGRGSARLEQAVARAVIAGAIEGRLERALGEAPVVERDRDAMGLDPGRPDRRIGHGARVTVVVAGHRAWRRRERAVDERTVVIARAVGTPRTSRSLRT